MDGLTRKKRRYVRISNRAERSCDTCRRRKLKCVRDKDQTQCVLCVFHQRACTYDEPRGRQGKAHSRPGIANTTQTDSPTQHSDPTTAGSQLHLAASPTSHDDLDARLRLTLGLHPTSHFKYIGPGSLHEDMLLDFIDPSFRYHNVADESKKFCRLAEGMTFLGRSDASTLYSSDDKDDTEAVEKLVRPHGPALVDLFFRIVHPSYPIIHKALFLEKYNRPNGYQGFTAPLLGAVYLLALDWWEHDQEMGESARQGKTAANTTKTTKVAKPDSDALAKLASRSLATVVHRPKISTVQGCLLLLQRAGGSPQGSIDGESQRSRNASTDCWVLTSQLVAVAEELGLHVDCSKWNVPAWERGIRRRLAWAVYMQDKWSSLIYGRPSHVQSSQWRIPPLTTDDFIENNGDTEKEDDKGQLLFIHLARLTQVMAEALAIFYSHDPDQYRAFSEADGMQTVELVKPIALKLRAWATALPASLRMEAVRPRKLCSNGYLHLSYFVTEIMVYRCIVRSLARSQVASAELLMLCRDAAKARLLHVMRFVEALRPEHLQAFWWFASPKSLAYIRTYVSILWATSQGEQEADYYRQKMDEFRWSLRVRARGVNFVTAAMRDMGESLADIDMSRPPFEQMADIRTQRQRGHTGETGQTDGSTPATTTSTLTQLPDDIGFTDGRVVDYMDDMVFQTTPEFLNDFGVSASEAFFADINSLHFGSSL
ncbi:nitrogen regulatory protein otam [Ophiostoma piceae UAMH 11346]|uniref:Nitrogen regulatory protein otam n=1 Tax=Ophiostoma piceae (strain UAMH 11346) TaxID=1262450 RepID=S3CBZ7_OPHP1|nr:nitrogen regulatory protein otam [Ophiostoma piceae UAMH 11346]